MSSERAILKGGDDDTTQGSNDTTTRGKGRQHNNVRQGEATCHSKGEQEERDEERREEGVLVLSFGWISV
ncbi:hypothetical protein AHAS_Ahas18G0133700 [Arachis hypogaea]